MAITSEKLSKELLRLASALNRADGRKNSWRRPRASSEVSPRSALRKRSPAAAIRAREGKWRRPAGRTATASAAPAPCAPTSAREAVTAVEGGRREGQEGRTTPHPAPQRAVPASPTPARQSAPGRSGPPAAPEAQPLSVLSLQPFVSWRASEGTRERAPRRAPAPEGGRRAQPGVGNGCCSRTPRPPLTPSPGRHFVLRRSRPPRDGCPETRTTKARAQGLRGLQVLPLPAGRRWRSETAAQRPSREGSGRFHFLWMGLRAGLSATHGLVCAPPGVCTLPKYAQPWELRGHRIPTFVFAALGVHESVGFHAF